MRKGRDRRGGSSRVELLLDALPILEVDELHELVLRHRFVRVEAAARAPVRDGLLPRPRGSEDDARRVEDHRVAHLAELRWRVPRSLAAALHHRGDEERARERFGDFPQLVIAARALDIERIRSGLEIALA